MEPVLNSTPAAALFSKVLTHSGMWSGVIARGKTLRLTDLQGGANVGMLLYNADQTSERYNMPDTLKGQHIFHLCHPFCLHWTWAGCSPPSPPIPLAGTTRSAAAPMPRS
jgi:Domain of unknown function (DUF1989)